MTLKELPVQKRRVALIASGGGHWIELVRFARAVADYDCLFISTSTGLRAPFGDRPVVQISDGSRDTIGSLIKSVLGLNRCLRAFRPDVIISTGAAPGAIALFLGKWLGATTIWIESIANSEELSLSGRLARSCADVMLTQWEHLADEQRHIHYMGRVL